MNVCSYCHTQWRVWEDGVYTHPSCHNCRPERIGQTIDFVRFGQPPASGRSKNHASGELEAGVSVYEIRNERIQFVGWYFDFTSRQAYRGTGRIVGWGSDYEPVVEISQIRKISKDETDKLRYGAE